MKRLITIGALAFALAGVAEKTIPSGQGNLRLCSQNFMIQYHDRIHDRWCATTWCFATAEAALNALQTRHLPAWDNADAFRIVYRETYQKVVAQ